MGDDPFAMISKFNATNASAPQQPAIDLGFGGDDAAAVGGGAAPAPAPAAAPAATELHKIVTLEAANPTGA